MYDAWADALKDNAAIFGDYLNRTYTHKEVTAELQVIRDGWHEIETPDERRSVNKALIMLYKSSPNISQPFVESAFCEFNIRQELWELHKGGMQS